MKKWKLDIKPTKSSTYILGILDDIVGFRFLHQLQNSYLYNNGEEQLFSVLYKYSGKEGYAKFEKEMMTSHLFVDHEDYGEFVLYKFRLPKQIEDTIKLFIAGRYSEFPVEHKDLIQSFLKKRGFSNADRIRGILDKDAAIREELEEKLRAKIGDGELSSAPNLETECFNLFAEELDFNNDKDIF